jgi:hypothetical protein
MASGNGLGWVGAGPNLDAAFDRNRQNLCCDRSAPPTVPSPENILFYSIVLPFIDILFTSAELAGDLRFNCICERA